jgi:hypothetical protein
MNFDYAFAALIAVTLLLCLRSAGTSVRVPARVARQKPSRARMD